MSEPAIAQDPASLLTTEPVFWYDRLANWIADHSSPILIKECRQALKSRQFVWTFALLLLAAVGWSFWGLSMSLVEGNEESGLYLLVGYIVILSFPLAVVVPFSCFRSLAREYEDDTIQLMAITTLSPYKIVNGKMVSALLQLLIYLSAIAPCVGFTYLLRGVDWIQILVMLSCSVLGSISLCATALMLAGLTRSQFFRVVITLGVAIGLVAAFVGWFLFLVEGVASGVFFSEAEWYVIMGILMTWILSTAWIGYHAAAALISFPAEDRSSRVRRAIAWQHTLILATLICPILLFSSPFPNGGWTWMLSVTSTHYWLIMGSMMCAENPGMSVRVRRTLPQTWLGRMGRGLQLPGPGRGYLFALANLWGWFAALALALFLVTTLDYQFAPRWIVTGGPAQDLALVGNWTDFLATLGINTSYATFYLSLVYLALFMLRRRMRLHPTLGLLFLILIFGLIHIGTVSLHSFVMRNEFYGRFTEFSVCLTGNWWWWISEMGPRNWQSYLTIREGLVSASLIVTAAFLLAGVCLVLSCRELVAPSAPIPQRILDEMAARRPGRAGPGESIDEIFADRNRA